MRDRATLGGAYMAGPPRGNRETTTRHRWVVLLHGADRGACIAWGGRLSDGRRVTLHLAAHCGTEAGSGRSLTE